MQWAQRQVRVDTRRGHMQGKPHRVHLDRGAAITGCQLQLDALRKRVSICQPVRRSHERLPAHAAERFELT